MKLHEIPSSPHVNYVTSSWLVASRTGIISSDWVFVTRDFVHHSLLGYCRAIVLGEPPSNSRPKDIRRKLHAAFLVFRPALQDGHGHHCRAPRSLPEPVLSSANFATGFKARTNCVASPSRRTTTGASRWGRANPRPRTGRCCTTTRASGSAARRRRGSATGRGREECAVTRGPCEGVATVPTGLEAAAEPSLASCVQAGSDRGGRRLRRPAASGAWPRLLGTLGPNAGSGGKAPPKTR